MNDIIGRRQSLGMTLIAASLIAVSPSLFAGNDGEEGPFERISSFLVFENTNVDDETVAEIVAASNDGNLLVYTDSETEKIGFVDITDPYNPQADGVVDLSGEPTSVGVKGGYALACVNTSTDFVNTSGNLEVIDIATRTIVRTIPLGGQPDAIAISPDGRYAAIAIENERDEDLGDGEPPQLPAGYVAIIDLAGDPADWTRRDVDLVNVPTLFPEDPEPEYVDINVFNVAAVTMQENNHIALIYLPTGDIIGDFSCGGADLTDVDVLENDLIEQNSSLDNVSREPDAITWTSALTFATADEGDLFGGSRGFTTWASWGEVLYEAGNSIEHLVARLGHYPEGRSENKGNEPEAVEYARYGWDRFLFVGSERSSVVVVYQLPPFPYLGNKFPIFRQVLPTGVAPEGLVAIPERDLFVVACEDDARDDKIRSTIMIYKRTGGSNYPTIVSENRDNNGLEGGGVPIPWGALSGFASNRNNVYTIHDSFYQKSRIYTMDARQEPAVITDELVINDDDGVLAQALSDLKDNLPGTDDFDPASLINDDGTVNLDPEGIEVGGRRTFYVASEGRGNLDNGVSNPDDRPFESPNLVVHVNRRGTIQSAILPPLDVTKNQFRFGFEGVARQGRFLYVAFQRSWSNAGDPADHVRIGRYDTRDNTWGFALYPLETPTSPNGGWVGLSEITSLGRRAFAVIERDNQGGPDAAIKRIYSFSVRGIDFKDHADTADFDIIHKTLVSDLLVDDAYGHTGGLVPEKLEGMTVLSDGTVLIVNDNDGVDDNSGETQLLRLPLFD